MVGLRKIFLPDVVENTYNPNTWKVKARGLRV
jgi:hypothetical protein